MDIMTIGEFRAWLDGFEHSFLDDVPDIDQWKLIREKISKISSNLSLQQPTLYQPYPNISPNTITSSRTAYPTASSIAKAIQSE